MLNAIDRILDRILSHVVVLFLLVTISVTALQVFFRYVLNRPFYWTEEVAQLLFLWLIYLGSALAVRYDKHLLVDVLYERLSPKNRRVVDIIVKVMVGVLLVVLTKEGIGLVISERASVTAALELSMGLVYLIVPLAGVLMLFFLLVPRKTRGDSPGKAAFKGESTPKGS